MVLDCYNTLPCFDEQQVLLTDNGVCRSAVVKFVILLLTLFTIANRAEELLLFKKKKLYSNI